MSREISAVIVEPTPTPQSFIIGVVLIAVALTVSGATLVALYELNHHLSASRGW